MGAQVRAGALLCLVACGPSSGIPPCRTPCGATVIGALPSQSGYCAALSEIERRTVELYSGMAAVDPRLPEVCASVHGWTIDVQPARWWLYGKAPVAGLTYCELRTMDIGNAPADEVALPHEMAHAAQACQAMPPVDSRDPGHSNWGPIYAALKGAGLQQ